MQVVTGVVKTMLVTLQVLIVVPQLTSMVSVHVIIVVIPNQIVQHQTPINRKAIGAISTVMALSSVGLI